MLVVATPISFGNANRLPLLYFAWIYLFAESMGTVETLWFLGDTLYSDSTAPWSFGTIAKWVYIAHGQICDGFALKGGSLVTTTVKDITDLVGLLSQGNWCAAMELIAFKSGLAEAAKRKYVECHLI